MSKKKQVKEVDPSVCPTHTDRKLVPTRTTGQMVCPIYECDYWRKKK